MKRVLATCLLTTLLGLGLALISMAGDNPSSKSNSITMLVMDPLSAELSCPCVKGYAQRDYHKLAKYLEVELKRPVQVAFSESLKGGLEKKTEGKVDLVIGKCSVVLMESAEMKMKLAPIASLTGKDGDTMMKGLFVVAANDPAKTVADLKGYKIYFGAKECDEKYSAALDVLKSLDVPVPDKKECCAACSDGALAVLEDAKKGEKSTTVISSYAQPLLEGCGTIKKGDLRMVRATDPVPFVTAFVHEQLPAGDRDLIQQAMMKMGSNKDLCTALETKTGFIAYVGSKKK